MSEQDEAGGFGPLSRFTSFMDVGYILDDDHNVITLTGEDASRRAWQWRYDNPDKIRVGFTAYSHDAYISTVFLSLDHDFSFSGKPVLFESMVFNVDSMPDLQTRYRTWAEAEAGHETLERAVELLGYRRDTEEARAAQVKLLADAASFEAKAEAKRLEFERSFGKAKRIIRVKKP